ncbi:MAG: VWA domain-containing protein [Lachnospiraceae bacterium]|nr:VWA domain-containing protein [Lachnospiraceae bacterium]MBQ3905129.1 VWA domain-containing protein [Lachnospiraceae bacterium]
MKNLTELVFVLDRSGSMRGLEKDTIGGFNGMIEKQKKEEGDVLVSAVLFDDKTEVLYDRVDIKTITPMTEDQYYVRGCTALLDAVGESIEHVKEVRKEVPKEQRPEKTIFIITTDGMENASRKYSYEKVKSLIEKRRAKDWEFIFLGANIDAAKEAGRIGIQASRAVNYKCDAAGTALNYSVLEKTVSKMRKCASAAAMGAALDAEDCFAEIREDCKKRS